MGMRKGMWMAMRSEVAGRCNGYPIANPSASALNPPACQQLCFCCFLWLLQLTRVHRAASLSSSAIKFRPGLRSGYVEPPICSLCVTGFDSCLIFLFHCILSHVSAFAIGPSGGRRIASSLDSSLRASSSAGPRVDYLSGPEIKLCLPFS